MWGGKKPRNPVERFFDKVEKTDTCWIWKGNKFHFGHGQFSIGSRWDNSNKSIPAHRFSWEIHNGKIPDKFCVLHKCDNPPCVNPDHLFLGTRFDNNKDMVKKGRAFHTNGTINGMHKLSDSNVINIRNLFKNGLNQREISRKFNISYGNVHCIVRRKSWKHI